VTVSSNGRGACASPSPSNHDDDDDLMAGRTKTKVKTTRTGKRGAAASHRSSQGFVPLAVRESISAAATWTASSESPQAAFNETNETVLTGSAGIRDGGAKCYKLLTEKAKLII